MATISWCSHLPCWTLTLHSLRPTTKTLEGTMFRKFLIGIIILGFVVSVIQLTSVVFSDTLDNGILSIASLVSGVVFAILIGLFQRDPNYPIIGLFTVFTSVIAIASINTQFSKNDIYTDSFVVSTLGPKTIRYDSFQYVELTSTSGSTEYSLSAENVTSYSVGDKVIVSLKQGFWGYPIIQSVE